MRGLLNSLHKSIASNSDASLFKKGVTFKRKQAAIQANKAVNAQVEKKYEDLNIFGKINRIITGDSTSVPKTYETKLEQEQLDHLLNAKGNLLEMKQKEIAKHQQDIDAAGGYEKWFAGQKEKETLAYQYLNDIDETNNIVNDMFVKGKVEHGGYLGDKVADYFTDEQYGLKRAGLAAGAFVAGSIGLRYSNGGSLTRNPDGKKDIAIVPFI